MRVSQLTNQINYQKWSTLIEKCRNSNMNVTQWCKENNIRKNKFYYWQRKICNTVCENLPAIKESKLEINAPTFAEIKLPSCKSSDDIALTLSINNTSIQIHNNASKDTIAAALKIIKTL